MKRAESAHMHIIKNDLQSLTSYIYIDKYCLVIHDDFNSDSDDITITRMVRYMATNHVLCENAKYTKASITRSFVTRFRYI